MTDTDSTKGKSCPYSFHLGYKTTSTVLIVMYFCDKIHTLSPPNFKIRIRVRFTISDWFIGRVRVRFLLLIQWRGMGGYLSFFINIIKFKLAVLLGIHVCQYKTSHLYWLMTLTLRSVEEYWKQIYRKSSKLYDISP